MVAMQLNERVPVKLLVRHVGSKKFLRATGRWTKRAEAALNFPSLLTAVHACLARGLKEVELVLRYSDDTADRCFRLSCV